MKKFVLTFPINKMPTYLLKSDYFGFYNDDLFLHNHKVKIVYIGETISRLKHITNFTCEILKRFANCDYCSLQEIDCDEMDGRYIYVDNICMLFDDYTRLAPLSEIMPDLFSKDFENCV